MRILCFEKLELRDYMSASPIASVALQNGTLSVKGGVQADFIEATEVGDNIQLRLNQNTYSFSTADVDRLFINGRSGSDTLVNRTSVNAVIFGSFGNDYIQGGSGDDVLRGSYGDDIITDFTGGGGSNVLDGGSGNDNLWGGTGPQDVIMGGTGDDVIYDIVGGDNVIYGGLGRDKIIARATDTVFSSFLDTVVSFDARPPITLDDGILYLTGDAADNTIVVSQLAESLVVTLTDASGSQTQTFNKSDVKMIAGLGGDGNDFYQNNTDISSVFYGTGGNDKLIGGSASDILKGGAGDDTIDGGLGRNDITGDAGSDLLLAGRGLNIVRTDGLDTFFSALGERNIILRT